MKRFISESDKIKIVVDTTIGENKTINISLENESFIYSELFITLSEENYHHFEYEPIYIKVGDTITVECEYEENITIEAIT